MISPSKSDEPKDGLEVLKSPPFKIIITNISIKENYSRKTIKFECIIDYSSYEEREFDAVYDFLIDCYRNSEEERISADITFERIPGGRGRLSFLNLIDEHNVRFREPK